MQDEHPTKWAKMIQSKAEREKYRKKLRAMPGVLWCDHYANECQCS